MIELLVLALLILFFSILFDVVIGEPPNRIHPVVFIGITISKLKTRFISKNNKIAAGCFFLISIILINTVPLVAVLYLLYIAKNTILLILFAVIYIYFLKSTFSIRGMGTHVNRIINALEKSDLDSAKKYTSMVVRRDTSSMDSEKIASAAVETIAEGFVDGYLTPMFFYAFFGIAGAMVARVINTMDSNIAYRDNIHYEFGRCTAIGDSITNFISSRMAPFMFSISAFLLGIKYAKTRIINTTDSLNAGYSIGAMAKVLGIRLEKSGEYIINPDAKSPGVNDIKKAMRIYYLSSVLTLLIFVIPVMLVLFVLHIFLLF